MFSSRFWVATGQCIDLRARRVIADQRAVLSENLTLQRPHRLDKPRIPRRHLLGGTSRILRFADAAAAAPNERVAPLEPVDEDAVQPTPCDERPACV